MNIQQLDDSEFTDETLTGADVEGDGYVLRLADGMSLFCAKVDGIVPKAGDVARLWGRGFGYPVRGIAINGQVVRYQTAEEHEAEWQKQAETFKREQAENETRVKAAGRDEMAMRAEAAPWPKTIEELTAYIQKQVSGEHTYGTCVYAASLSATAAFYFVAGVLGMTGFQSGCADFDILRRTRGMKGPFMLVNLEDALYPQYDLQAKVSEFIAKNGEWLADEARKNLASRALAHPDVIAHWKRLVSLGISHPPQEGA